MANRGICGEAGKTVRAAALQSHAKLRKRRIGAVTLVRLHQAEKRLANGFEKHFVFGASVLLLNDDQRLGGMGVSAANFIPQNRNLRVLAAPTDNGPVR